MDIRLLLTTNVIHSLYFKLDRVVKREARDMKVFKNAWYAFLQFLQILAIFSDKFDHVINKTFFFGSEGFGHTKSAITASHCNV